MVKPAVWSTFWPSKGHEVPSVSSKHRDLGHSHAQNSNFWPLELKPDGRKQFSPKWKRDAFQMSSFCGVKGFHPQIPRKALNTHDLAQVTHGRKPPPLATTVLWSSQSVADPQGSNV
jgi:hypothetical protein